MNDRLLTMGADIWLLPGVSLSMNFELASSRENFDTLQTSIVLLLGVSPSVNFQAASGREKFVTLQTSK